MKRQGADRRYSFSPGQRFRYWFDNRMARGSFGLILALVAASVLLAIVVAVLIVLLGFSPEGEASPVIWNGIATVINAWMPSFEDGGPGYLILMSVIALAGVLFTSVLIGIITSAIEVRIDNLKKGNSRVLERDHIVVLGFNPGEYTLLRQLILAAEGRPTCIVLAEDMEREEMEQAVRENVDIPGNARIVCRTVDITDPASIEKCSAETCRTIIVSPTDDMRTIKAVLAVSTLLEAKGAPEIAVNAVISKNEYRFPPSLVEANHITTLLTHGVLAKMIAHACTQTGLSDCFKVLFDFEDSEFHLVAADGIDGLSFGELMARLDNAVPAGVCRDGKIALDPSEDYRLRATDRLLVFAEESGSAVLGPETTEPMPDVEAAPAMEEATTDTVIFGHNETLPIILRELPPNVAHAVLVGRATSSQERDRLLQVASDRNLRLTFVDDPVGTEETLAKLAGMAEHVVVLNRHDCDPEEADMEGIFLLLNLRDIRSRYGLRFNFTMEMQREHNQRLVSGGDHTDYIVSSSMSSLILAQLAENPELIDVFRELLSNAGNGIFLKNAGQMRLTGRHRVRDLRRIMLRRGYILLGHCDAEIRSRFDLLLDEEIALTADDRLIVIGEG